MAGIGFELKKIYRKDGISRGLLGAMYSSIVTVGPTILVIATILVLYAVLDMTNVGMAKRELLTSTILYSFVFSGILAAPMNAVFSRFLADKIYMDKKQDILPSYYVGLALISAVAMLAALPVLLSLYFRGGVDLPFILGAYVLWTTNVVVFFSITYLHGTKDYKVIASFFGIAMVVGGLVAFILFRLTHLDHIHSILYGLDLGFFMIAACEFGYIRFYFRESSGNYLESLTYIWKYKPIFLTNLFYVLGLYIHNFVFWATPQHLVVAETYYSCVSYDMATFLAMFTNISVMVIFTVVAETEFHETYQKYMEAVIGGTYKLIQKNKRIMFRTLSVQVGQVFSIQVAITCLVFLFLHIFGESLGFSSMTMTIYPLLAVGFLGVFMTNCNIIYLFYLDDTIGSTITGALFFGVTWIATIFSKDFTAAFYGAGLVAGMLTAWTYSFFRLRHLERNFEAHVFCRYKIIDTMKSSVKGKVVYRKES